MPDRWMPLVKLALSAEAFREVPRHPAYKYEHTDGVGWISPRPRYFHALLDLTAPLQNQDKRTQVRSLEPADWERLPPLFAAAFHNQQPFACLADGPRLEAARVCLARVADGEDGPVMADCCRVAVLPGNDQPLGA